MTQEQKELLKRDLCSRLDTNLVCSIYRVDDYGVGYRDEILSGYCKGDIWYEFYFGDDCGIGIDDVSKIKPYLIPISKMTEEQRLELETITGETIGFDAYSLHDFTGYSEISLSRTMEIIQWCYENHIDINGLIPMDLAIEAPEGMYN